MLHVAIVCYKPLLMGYNAFCFIMLMCGIILKHFLKKIATGVFLDVCTVCIIAIWLVTIKMCHSDGWHNIRPVLGFSQLHLFIIIYWS